MTEIGEVTGVRGERATVRFPRKGECDKCLICSVVKEGSRVELDLDNTLKLNVGDFVEVEVFSRRAYRAYLLIYLIPLVLVALCAGLGTLAGMAPAVILALAGLIAGLAFAVPIDICVLRKNLGRKPKMTKVVREADYFNAVKRIKGEN